MGKPYMKDGKWYRSGNEMDSLAISLMNKDKNTSKGLGLSKVSDNNNTIVKPPVQKKPRPPGQSKSPQDGINKKNREDRMMNTIESLKDRKKKFSNMFNFGN